MKSSFACRSSFRSRHRVRWPGSCDVIQAAHGNGDGWLCRLRLSLEAQRS